MSSELITALIILFLTSGIGWATWVTKKLILVHESQKYMTKNLFLIDWDKIPKKPLNDIFKDHS